MMNLISVTQALRPYSKFDMINKATLEHAAARGTEVHRICELLARGVWVPGIDDECRGYVESFKIWLSKMVVEVIAVEDELIDDALGFVGHPDLIVALKDGHTYVVDLKTPVSHNRLWRAQLAAYSYLAKKHYQIKDVGSLMLHPDGKAPKMNWYTDNKNDLVAFLSAVNACRYFSQQ